MLKKSGVAISLWHIKQIAISSLCRLCFNKMYENLWHLELTVDGVVEDLGFSGDCGWI